MKIIPQIKRYFYYKNAALLILLVSDDFPLKEILYRTKIDKLKERKAS